MAYAFCIAKAYMDDALSRGLDVDEFAGRLSFNFNIFGQLFDRVSVAAAVHDLTSWLGLPGQRLNNPASQEYWRVYPSNA